jgi:hypothetical protein
MVEGAMERQSEGTYFFFSFTISENPRNLRNLCSILNLMDG